MVEHQWVKLEIWGSDPDLDTNFSLNIYMEIQSDPFGKTQNEYIIKGEL